MIEQKSTVQFYSYYRKHTTQPWLDHERKTISKRNVNDDITIFLAIFRGYIKFLMEKVFEGHEVQLAHRYTLGTVSIVGNKVKAKFDENGKPTNLAPDWVKTKELWSKDADAKQRKELIYHLNEHSEGIRYTINWAKVKSNVPYRILWFYSIVFARQNKRTVPKKIREGKEYTVYND